MGDLGTVSTGNELLKRLAMAKRADLEALLGDLKLHRYQHGDKTDAALIERLNNKAKVTMRKAYGYRTFRIAELSLYHVLGRLPEPKLAHKFF